MSGVRDAHAALAGLLESLTITEPIAESVKRAYKFIPKTGTQLKDFPCAFATFEQRPITFGPAILHKDYTSHVYLVAGPSSVDADVRADVAAALLDAFITRLAESENTIRLNGTVALVQSLRGQSPDTLDVISWGNVGLIAVELFIDFKITEVPGYSS